MTFDDFWEIKGGGCDYDIGQFIWDEAVKQERVRALAVIDGIILHADSDSWITACEEIQDAIAKYDREANDV